MPLVIFAGQLRRSQKLCYQIPPPVPMAMPAPSPQTDVSGGNGGWGACISISPSKHSSLSQILSVLWLRSEEHSCTSASPTASPDQRSGTRRCSKLGGAPLPSSQCMVRSTRNLVSCQLFCRMRVPLVWCFLGGTLPTIHRQPRGCATARNRPRPGKVSTTFIGYEQ